MRPALLLAVVLLVVAAAGAQTVPPEPDSPPAELGSNLPDGPAKGLVLVQCNHCHGLEWIERSGADEEGWTSRIRRMNRAGAMIPAEQIPIMASYLARVLPERLRPPPTKRRASFAKP